MANNKIISIPIDSLIPYHEYPFRLYEDERLEEMVESIREQGILKPVIVLRRDKGFEILSGHNRIKAARIVRLKMIPSIIKENLSDDEAYVYLIETNLLQRDFRDLLTSEKAAILKARYERGTSQSKWKNILGEIAELEGKTCEEVYSFGEPSTRDAVGSEFGLSVSSVGRLLKLNDLIEPLKEMLDRGALHNDVALQLAFLPEEEQQLVYEEVRDTETRLTVDMAIQLRSHSGELRKAMIRRYIGKAPIKKRCYKVPGKIVDKYFQGMDPNMVDSIVEQALDAWFRNKRGN